MFSSPHLRPNQLMTPIIFCSSVIIIIRGPSCVGLWLNYPEYHWGRETTNSTYNPHLSPSGWAWQLSGEIASDLASVLNITLQPLTCTLWKTPHTNMLIYCDTESLSANHKQSFLSIVFQTVINNDCLEVCRCLACLRGSSLAEKSLLCWARYWTLAVGVALSAAVEMGHIGSWLPQLTFSLINKGTKSFQHSYKVSKMH